MTDYLVMPDLEAIVAKAIRDLQYRTYSSIPKRPEWPLIVVHRVGGTPAIATTYDEARIQVDVWGGAEGDGAGAATKSEIQDMSQNARVAIHRLAGTKVTEPVPAFISSVQDGTGLTWLQDPTTGRDRYFFQVIVMGRTLWEANNDT